MPVTVEDLQGEGVIVEVLDPAEAETMGAFVEDAMSQEDALEAALPLEDQERLAG